MAIALRDVIYVIYQVSDSLMPRGYFLGKGFEKDQLHLYCSVWEGKLETKKEAPEILRILFRTFNIDHPDGYNARSLSCGDVVGLYDQGNWSYYYCARIGFDDVTEVFGSALSLP